MSGHHGSHSGGSRYRGSRDRSRSPRRETERDHDYHDRRYEGRSDNRFLGREGQGGSPPHNQSYRGGGDRGGYEDFGYKQSSMPPLPHAAPLPTNAKAIPYPEEKLPKGCVGERIMVETNHHALLTLPLFPIYSYDLRFRVPPECQLRGDDEVTATQMARVLMQLQNLFSEGFVFDGVSLGWSPKEVIPIGKKRITVLQMGQSQIGGRPNTVEMMMINRGPLSIRDAVQVLRTGSLVTDPMGDPKLESILKWIQAVYRQQPATQFVSRPNSNCYFDRDNIPRMPLASTGNVLEAQRGIFQTMQLRFGRITINVDTATTPFWVPDVSLIDLLGRILGISDSRNVENEFLKNPSQFFLGCSKILGIYFNVRHLNDKQNAKKLRFLKWTLQDAIQSTFEETGTNGVQQLTNVLNYYSRKWGIKLQYPRLPLAVSFSGAMFPLELCYSSRGERYRGVLQGVETSDFIRFATAPAFVRREQIQQGLKMLAWHEQTNPRLHGLSVNPHMMEIKARILPSPEVIYGDNKKLQPQNGRWNLKLLRLLKPSQIRSWVLLYIPDGRCAVEETLSQFCGEIYRGFQSLGISVPKSPPPILLGNPHGDMFRVLREAIAKAEGTFNAKPDLIFVLTGRADKDLYEACKKVLDSHVGIASQFLLEQKALKQRGQLQYVANIGLKVNVKLGGTNSIIIEPMFRSRRFMLIGGDCSLPNPTALRQETPPPATVSLVGTWDRECSAYTAITSVQPAPRANLIENAGPMFSELLQRYKQKNQGQLPESILYYRDGSSESEFNAIKIHEGKILKDLTRESGTKITIIIAIKRHHTRFFLPQAYQNYASKLGNVPAGTVVENSCISNDVFIVAHGDLQGTKRPTRYVVTIDENRLSADDFQRVTFNLCSTYARATVSVAVCPPIYYADQACERGRLHLADTHGNDRVLLPVHNNLKYNMYWQ